MMFIRVEKNKKKVLLTKLTKKRKMKAFYKMKEIVLNEFGNEWWHDKEVEGGWKYLFVVKYEENDKGKEISENVKNYFKRINNVVNEICNKEVNLVENSKKIEDIIENRKGKKYEYFKKVVVTFFENSFSIEITNTKKVI